MNISSRPGRPAADHGYCGRFAPSPTGPLHFGSLVTALAGFLQARTRGGRWLLRIDDIDPPREQPGAAADIRSTLARCHLEWDGEVITQSTHRERHRAVLATLLAEGKAYRCHCSRRQTGSRPYPGTCRDRHLGAQGRFSVRVRVAADPLVIDDALQGRQAWDPGRDSGDFVVWRVEDLPAYHLAAVLDDAEAGITEVVRGADLLASAPRQRYLQRLLGVPEPAYLHLPAAVDAAGCKLSKQTHAAPITIRPVAESLVAALTWLGQAPPPDLARAPAVEVIAWGLANWRLDCVPRAGTLRAPDFAS